MGNPHPAHDKHATPGPQGHGHPGPGHHGPLHEPVEIDPEHDIDAKMSTVLIIVGAVVFFVGFWLLLPIFDEVMTRERARKIDGRPNEELQQLVDSERAFLHGEGAKNKKTIEQVMAEKTPK